MKKHSLITQLTLLTLLSPLLTFAQGDDDAGKKIGTGVVSFLVVLGVIGLISWVRSKNKKEDHNKPL